MLEAGDSDQFASVLSAADAGEALRRRMQLKTLLAGMGETFRVLLARRERLGEGKNRLKHFGRKMKKAPETGALE